MNQKHDRPFSQAVAVTPHDSNNLATPSRALYIGGAGNLSVQMGGATVTFQGALAGTILPLVVTRVNSTGTTATNIRSLN